MPKITFKMSKSLQNCPFVSVQKRGTTWNSHSIKICKIYKSTSFYVEILKTSDTWMRILTPVEDEWVEGVAATSVFEKRELIK